MKLTFPAEIRTRRLILRPPRLSDARAIFEAYAQDAEVTRFLVWTPHATVENTRNFLRWCVEQNRMQNNYAYVLRLRSNGKVVGMADLRTGGSQMEIGYVLARTFWGRGLMAEAVKSLTAAALKNPSIFRVYAACHVDNRGIGASAGKSGLSTRGPVAKIRGFAQHQHHAS